MQVVLILVNKVHVVYPTGLCRKFASFFKKVFIQLYANSRITDCYETFVLQVLSTLLIDGPSSCFYKSLLENNIGHEYSSSAG